MSSVRSLPADALLELLLIASDTLSPEEMAGRFVPQVGERIGLSAAAIFLPRSDDGEGPPRLVAKCWRWPMAASSSATSFRC